MVLFDDFIINKNEPVYLQIIRYLKIQIHLENIKNNDELPSRRELAAKLGINPNTVQKAYKIFEECGFMKTEGNNRSVVTIDNKGKDAIKAELTQEAVSDFIKRAKEMKLSYEDTIQLIKRSW